MAVKTIPDGYHAVTPYLSVAGAARAIEFYKRAFGATEIMRLDAPGGTLGHAEIRIGDSVVMLADESPTADNKGPKSLGGTSVSLLVYLHDVDAVFQRALDAGATQLRAVQDQFYGDRSGTLEDPFGHVWTIATHLEDLSPDEMKRRADKAMSGQSSPT